MRSVELFAGVGGLAMGVSLAGFRPQAMLEWNRWACDTIRENAANGYPLVQDWPLTQGDVRDFDFGQISGEIDLVSGGPPCQPFSMGGKHRANNDSRDMFPVTVDVIRRLRPRSFIIENVKGLTRANFSNYFSYILLQLEFPNIRRRCNEDFLDHMARLEHLKTSQAKRGLKYNIVWRVLNSADYGVPQKRERVFIVGFRNDLGIEWSFPEATHSFDALLESQFVSGEYWDEHKVPKSQRLTVHDRIARRVEKISAMNDRPLLESARWRTVRDGLKGLPPPTPGNSREYVRNHRLQPGAKAYSGHTGSPLDLPSKALKAGVHGVPGGENMMVLPDGNVRYFTAREAARMQTIPDGYELHGAWSEVMRQLGNAVPVKLAQCVASSVAEALVLNTETDLKKLSRSLV